MTAYDSSDTSQFLWYPSPSQRFIHLPLWRRSVTVHNCASFVHWVLWVHGQRKCPKCIQWIVSVPSPFVYSDNRQYSWILLQLQISIYSGFFQPFRIDALRLWRQSAECIMPETIKDIKDEWRWSRHTTKNAKGKTFNTAPATRWCGECHTRWSRRAPPVWWK